jgi:hypothetical protein
MQNVSSPHELRVLSAEEYDFATETSARSQIVFRTKSSNTGARK